MKKLIFIALLFLVSCGPIYDTRYHYHPPEDFEGRKCINSCVASRDRCKSFCQRDKNECLRRVEQKAQNDYDDYVARCNRGQRERASLYRHECVFDKKKFSDFRHEGDCSANCESGCGHNYNDCYTNCGGRLKTQRVCVAFCSQG